MWNSGLEESQAGIKIARNNTSNLRYADDTTLVAESREELKGLLMRVKKGSEKPGLKLSMQKTKIMASGPITSSQKIGGASSRGENSYGLETVCKVNVVICMQFFFGLESFLLNRASV